MGSREKSKDMHPNTIAINLAKDIFELAFTDAQGRVIERKRLTRKAFARIMEQRPPLRVLMEACGSAHYWGHRFPREGHTYGRVQSVAGVLHEFGVVAPPGAARYRRRCAMLWRMTQESMNC